MEAEPDSFSGTGPFQVSRVLEAVAPLVVPPRQAMPEVLAVQVVQPRLVEDQEGTQVFRVALLVAAVEVASPIREMVLLHRAQVRPDRSASPGVAEPLLQCPATSSGSAST